MARNSGRHRTRSSGSRTNSSRRDRGVFLFVGGMAVVSMLFLTHASELHLSADHHADVAADNVLPATLDETRLGADLLPIWTSKSNSNNSVEVILTRLKRHLSATLGRFIPPTDAACEWSWQRLKCAPSESCKLKPRWGDFHLGHACRLRTSEEEKEEEKRQQQQQQGGGEGKAKKWVGTMWGKVEGTTGGAWRMLDHGRDRAVHHTVRGFNATVESVKAKLPETDKECKFDVVQSVAQRKLVCVPAETCAFQYRAGDLMVNRACRLKK